MPADHRGRAGRSTRSAASQCPCPNLGGSGHFCRRRGAFTAFADLKGGRSGQSPLFWPLKPAVAELGSVTGSHLRPAGRSSGSITDGSARSGAQGHPAGDSAWPRAHDPAGARRANDQGADRGGGAGEARRSTRVCCQRHPGKGDQAALLPPPRGPARGGRALLRRLLLFSFFLSRAEQHGQICKQNEEQLYLNGPDAFTSPRASSAGRVRGRPAGTWAAGSRPPRLPASCVSGWSPRWQQPFVLLFPGRHLLTCLEAKGGWAHLINKAK